MTEFVLQHVHFRFWDQSFWFWSWLYICRQHMSWIHTISLESSCTFLEKRGRFWRQQFLSPINNDAILGAYYLFFISWKINSEREKGTVGDTMHGQRPEASFFCNKVDWFYPVREVLSWSQFNAPYLKKDKIFYKTLQRDI